MIQDKLHVHVQASPVDVIAQKEVISVGRKPSLVEVSEQISELSVDVSDDVDGRLKLQQHRLLEKHLPGHQAQLADLILRESHLLWHTSKRPVNETAIKSHRHRVSCKI